MEIIGQKRNIQSLKEKVRIHQHSPKLPEFAKSQDATNGSHSSE